MSGPGVWVSTLVTRLFDALCWPLAALGDWGPPAGLGVLCGLLAVWVWARTTNQAAVRRTRAQLQAELLAVRLFQHDVRVSLAIQASLVRGALRHLRHAGWPLLLLTGPAVLIYPQLEGRCGVRPLQVGESALLTAWLYPGYDWAAAGATVVSESDALVVETGPVRLPGARALVWRVRARAPGLHRLQWRAEGTAVTKEAQVGGGQRLLSAVRPRHGVWSALRHPGEPPLPPAAQLLRLSLDYPRRQLHLGPWRGGWLWLFFAGSMVGGLGAKRLWKVEM